jgi:hypothetical protein
MASTALPSNTRFRPKDRKLLVVVEYTNGAKAYARVDRDKAALGGASLSAVVRQCQASGDIPAGAVARIIRAH